MNTTKINGSDYVMEALAPTSTSGGFWKLVQLWYWKCRV